jgi:hypothetical protein
MKKPPMRRIFQTSGLPRASHVFMASRVEMGRVELPSRDDCGWYLQRVESLVCSRHYTLKDFQNEYGDMTFIEDLNQVRFQIRPLLYEIPDYLLREGSR